MCNAPGCTETKIKAMGLCGRHYNIYHRHGLIPKMRGVRISDCSCGEAFIEGVGCGRCRVEARILSRKGVVA